MDKIPELLKDRLVLASSILSLAIVVAAIVLAYGMALLGERIEMAGARASGPSTLDVSVSGKGPIEIRESK